MNAKACCPSLEWYINVRGPYGSNTDLRVDVWNTNRESSAISISILESVAVGERQPIVKLQFSLCQQG